MLIHRLMSRSFLLTINARLEGFTVSIIMIHGVIFLALLAACTTTEKTMTPVEITAQGNKQSEATRAVLKEDLSEWARNYQEDHPISSSMQTPTSRPRPQAVIAQVNQSGPSGSYEGLRSSQQDESIEQGSSFLSNLGTGFGYLGTGLSYLGSGLLNTLEFLGKVAVVAGPQMLNLMQGHSGGSAYSFPSYPSSGASGLSSGAGSGYSGDSSSYSSGATQMSTGTGCSYEGNDFGKSRPGAVWGTDWDGKPCVARQDSPKPTPTPTPRSSSASYSGPTRSSK